MRLGSGSVHQLDINEVDSYGFWDQSLDIMPAMSRYSLVDSHGVYIAEMVGSNSSCKISCIFVRVFVTKLAAETFETKHNNEMKWGQDGDGMGSW